MRIPIKVFEEGICFICKKKTEKNAYLHYECGITYEDYKRKKIEKNDLSEELEKNKQGKS